MRLLPVAARRRGGRGPAVAVAAVVALLLVGAAGAAGVAWSRSWPRRVGETLRRALEGAVLEPASLQVSVASRPAFALLGGRIDRLTVAGRGLKAGEVVADRFRLEGEGIRLDLAASAREGRLVIASARRLDVQLVLSEQAINDYLQRNGQLASLLRVRLLPEGPRLVLEASVQQETVSLGLEGRLAVEPGNVVALLPDRLSIERDGTPALQLDVSGSPGVLRVPVGPLPVPVAIDRLETADGELWVYGHYAPASP
ncbi:MAG TPA: DUF2993 domain-containing protein [Limnochordales bacterium]